MTTWGTREARDVLWFLADRLNGNGGDRGRSSDAMISAAIKGNVPALDDRPRDLADYTRCCDAFARAPRALQEQMLPILVGWGCDLATPMAAM